MLICPAVYELCEQQGSGRQQQAAADDEGQAEAADEKPLIMVPAMQPRLAAVRNRPLLKSGASDATQASRY